MRIAALTRPLPGESRNGDAFLVASWGPDGKGKAMVLSNPDAPERLPAPAVVEIEEKDVAFVAVLDGVGHGAEAAATTGKLLECLRCHHRLDLESLVRECHQRSAHTRGVTLGLALIERAASRIHHIGVGNVKTMVCRTPPGSEADPVPPSIDRPVSGDLRVRTFANNNGTVGYAIPPRLHTTTSTFSPGDMVIMCSDGVGQERLLEDVAKPGPRTTERIAWSILASSSRSSDDAVVVVAR